MITIAFTPGQGSDLDTGTIHINPEQIIAYWEEQWMGEDIYRTVIRMSNGSLFYVAHSPDDIYQFLLDNHRGAKEHGETDRT